LGFRGQRPESLPFREQIVLANAEIWGFCLRLKVVLQMFKEFRKSKSTQHNDLLFPIPFVILILSGHKEHPP